MSETIRVATIAGKFDYFRSVMHRLENRYSGKGWTLDNNERLVFAETDQRPDDIFSSPPEPPEVALTPQGRWRVMLLSERGQFVGHAVIIAYESGFGTVTKVKFVDGCYPNDLEAKPIGIGFDSFAQMILQEALAEHQVGGVSAEFDAIVRLKPQKRGREFQKLFAKMISQHSGWSQEESVNTSSEEIDVVANHEREYYLIECKWEKHSVGPDVVNHLYGKLVDRPSTTKGLIASLSGFTSAAEETLKNKISDRVILLFGPWDICALMYARVSFDDLLSEKLDALVKRREIQYN